MDWDREVISDGRLERSEEQFRRRFEDQMNQQGQVAQREFKNKPIERYCCLESIFILVMSNREVLS